MRTTLSIALLLIVSGCELHSSIDESRIVAGVDLDAMFAPPTGDEIASIRTDWEARDVSARQVIIEHTESITMLGVPATVTILSHDIDGVRHYGAVLRADGLDAESAPVVVYAHGSDNGVDVQEAIILLGSFAQVSNRTVFVIPSFRSESIRLGDRSWQSGGSASPWDRDVDDALGLLSAALFAEPAADPNRIGIVGVSRGGAVAMLMDARDDRIDGVFSMMAPTDFFGPFVQEITEEILLDEFRDLPGLDVLAHDFIRPLRDTDRSLEEVRLEYVRRSAVLFASDIGTLHVHHGAQDSVVPISQAQSMVSVMQSLGRTAPDFTYTVYPDGEHHPLTLDGVLLAAQAFMEGLMAGS